MLDPDPHKTDADPKHWKKQIKIPVLYRYLTLQETSSTLQFFLDAK
jgi:hypothetical protein